MVSHPVFDKFAAANPSMKKHCFAEEDRAIATKSGVVKAYHSRHNMSTE